MDFARKIGKSVEPRPLKRTRVPFVTTKDNPLSEDRTSFSEDRRLANWRKWLANRKRQNRRVQTATGRSRSDQLQNSSEKYRATVEVRSLMEHAISVPAIVDKYRGGPDFWKTPEFLPTRRDASLLEVSLTLTRKDLNLRPDLLHVGLADLMADERDLAELQVKEEPLKRSGYLKTRKHELAEEIASLLPKQPETATLVVRGHAFREKKPQPRIPVITITRPDEEESCEVDQATVLKIQDREFVRRRSLVGTEPTVTWSLTFNGKIGERVEREIVLENKGSRVVTYHWRDSSVHSIGVSFERRVSPFHFNKTGDLVLPGQTVTIKVWYLPRARGLFIESWRLVTEPRMSPTAFVFRLRGCAFDVLNAERADRRTIDEHLDRRVRDSTIRSIVEEIVAGVKRVEPLAPLYETLFLQKELFDSSNPHYFYHPSIAMQLREMYSNVTDESAPTWNLDVMRNTILQIRETDHRRDTLARFNDLCKQCLKPNFYDVARDRKSNAVYDVLCAFANTFENESEFVRSNSTIREEAATTPKIHRQKLTISSQSSINGTREAHSARSMNRSEIVQLQRETDFGLNLQPYNEVFFIRIYKALGDAIERVCAIIDSHNRLNEPYT